MTIAILKAAAEAENGDDLHLVRLLILLSAADAKCKKPETKSKAVEGITKLAKLDFLLRYPVYLERALIALDKPKERAAVLPRERTTIETKMIRFRYGPWDGRYRRWLSLLSARGLITLAKQGQKIDLGLTDRGRELAEALGREHMFTDWQIRSKVVVDAVGNMAAVRLKDFVYKIVPEITGLRWGEEIVNFGHSKRSIGTENEV